MLQRKGVGGPTCRVERDALRAASPTDCKMKSGKYRNGPGGSTSTLMCDSLAIAGDSSKPEEDADHVQDGLLAP